MRRLLLALLPVLLAGCPAPADPPAPEPATAPAEEIPAAETAAPAVAPETPTPITEAELRAICGVYRKALRSRWDDAQTREAILALELGSTTARRHRQAISTPRTNISRSHLRSKSAPRRSL